MVFNVSCYAEISQAEAAEESRFDQNMSLHPYFDFDVMLNVTARVGQTAFLHCRVEQLGDKSVSLIFATLSLYYLDRCRLYSAHFKHRDLRKLSRKVRKFPIS